MAAICINIWEELQICNVINVEKKFLAKPEGKTYLFSDQNCSKTIPLRATHTFEAHTWGSTFPWAMIMYSYLSQFSSTLVSIWHVLGRGTNCNVKVAVTCPLLGWICQKVFPRGVCSLFSFWNRTESCNGSTEGSIMIACPRAIY